jgi:cyclic beta-1,2-glucan synthetase
MEHVVAERATEQLLEDDPAGAYSRMDESTRGGYRSALARLVSRSGRSPEAVAERALERARRAAEEGAGDDAAAHVGYWLIGPGAAELERDVGAALDLGERVLRDLRRRPELYYASLTLPLIATLSLAIAAYLAAQGASRALIFAAVLVGLPISAAYATAAARALLQRGIPPRLLPRMEFAEGIPDEHRTLVVVPAIVASPERLIELLRRVQAIAAGNADRNARFALLVDFPDHSAQCDAGDERILATAGAAVAQLNAAHGDDLGDRFFVLHRERCWNPAENAWMGWERKRGKLEELNRLLRAPESKTTYRWIAGDFGRFVAEHPIRYVISLDEDTWLEAGEARELVRAAAHPLNQPRFDPLQRRVVAGYGILQPAVFRHMPPARTRFSDFYFGAVPILPRPYRPQMPSFAFDVLDRGRYHGKGLYHVDAFRACLDGAFPQNRVLSHDHLEGYFTRVAHLHDSFLLEPFQSRYYTRMLQRHRWIRGDLQSLPWLAPWVRDGRGKMQKNPIALLAWRGLGGIIGEHLLVPARLAFLLLALLALPTSILPWIAFVFGHAISGFVTMVLMVGMAAARSRRDREAPAGTAQPLQARMIASFMLARCLHLAFNAAVLAHEAAVALDAMARAATRMLVTRRRMLQWTAQRQVEGAGHRRLVDYFRFMWSSAVVGVGVLTAVAWLNPDRLAVAAPFATAWIVAFLAVWYLDQPLQMREAAAGQQPR